MNDLLPLLQTIVGHPLFKGVLILLLVNILSGIVAGMYQHNLHLAELGDWLMSRAVPYIGGGICMQLVVIALPEELSGVSALAGTAVWAFVIASLIGKILDNLRVMGMPIPRFLGDGSKPDATATP